MSPDAIFILHGCSTNQIKVALSMLARARKCGLIAEEAVGACDCKMKSKYVMRKIRYLVAE